MGRPRHLTLADLADLPPEALQAEWQRRCGGPAPNLTPELLRLGLSYQLQQRQHGGVSRSTAALLREVAAPTRGADNKPPLPRRLTPGTRLVRDWHAVGYTVTVLETGFAYDGKVWPSLSAIAKAITGTHWNGPRFFGLTGAAR